MRGAEDRKEEANRGWLTKRRNKTEQSSSVIRSGRISGRGARNHTRSGGCCGHRAVERSRARRDQEEEEEEEEELRVLEKKEGEEERRIGRK